jgi:hypothetical protein
VLATFRYLLASAMVYAGSFLGSKVLAAAAPVSIRIL